MRDAWYNEAMNRNGGILYEYEEGAPTGARGKYFHFAVFGALTFGILIWGLYSLFSLAAKVGLRAAWSANSGGMFAVLVVLVIFAFSVLPYMKRLNSRGTKRRFTVYADKIVFLSEKKTTILRESLDFIRLDMRRAGCIPSIERTDGSALSSDMILPPAAALFLKKEFGTRVKVSRAEKGKIPVSVPVLCVAAVVFSVGLAVTVLSRTVNVPPLFLGIFFLGGGCVLACVAFERVALVKEVFLPLCTGAVFFWAPTGLAAAFAEIEGASFSLADFLGDFSFSAFYCAWIYLTAIGAYFMLGALFCLIRYFRYKKMK